MNLKIWTLTLFGVVMGLAYVYGFTQGFEWLLWILVVLICGAVIAKAADSQIFVKGVVVGLFIGIFCAVIQSVMFNTYLLNNKNSLDGFKQIPVSMEPQYVLLFAGPFMGIFIGLVIGLIAFLIDKITGKKIH
ncbi:MAG TPA: hypothetical protein PKD83_09265 [Ignavibacteria bacterium]|nr:hypothetical protein [Ignavibacteria bacterium]